MKKSIIFFGFVFVLAGFLSFVAPQTALAEGSWSVRDTGTTKELTSISCPAPRTCYMVSGLYLFGGTGAIIKTTDGGETFTLLKSPTLNPLQSISCPSANVCYAAGDFGTFLRTKDGGETWTQSDLGSKSNPPQFTGIKAIDADKILVVGKDGEAYRSIDGGVTWGRPSLRTVADLRSPYFADVLVGYIVGSDGVLLKTENSGATWSFLKPIPGIKEITRIAGFGSNTLYVIGNVIQKSTDGGVTWNVVTAGTAENFKVIVAESADTAYLVADVNAIFKTVNGGVAWEKENPGSSVFLRDAVCPVSGYCLAVGSAGKVLRLGTPPAAPPPPPPPAPEPVVVAPAVATSTPAPVVTPPLVVAPAPVVPEPVAIVPVSEPTIVEAVSTEWSGTFVRSMKRGTNGNDIKKLQEVLLGVSGVYTDGEVTGYFGPATAKAVGRLQAMYGIAQEGEAGYGEVGPKTRRKLNEILQNGAAPVPNAAATPAESAAVAASGRQFASVRSLKKGSRGDDVRVLQGLLASDREVYPDGEVTGYFGPMTAKAVGRFQEKYEIAFPGDDGYGEAGPRTKARLLEVAR